MTNLTVLVNNYSVVCLISPVHMLPLLLNFKAHFAEMAPQLGMS